MQPKNKNTKKERNWQRKEAAKRASFLYDPQTGRYRNNDNRQQSFGKIVK